MSNVNIFGLNVVLFCAVNVGFLRFPSLSACVRLKDEKYLDYRTNALLFNSVLNNSYRQQIFFESLNFFTPGFTS